jgi:oligoribonuclease NrnB/cAMP/cGMP phosphodiesterase (DHH superfamily)
MFKQAIDFIKNCKGKTVIIYDTDGDGIGAAAILAKTLKRLFKKYPKAIPGHHDLCYITKNNYDEISKQKADRIIIVDIAVDQKPEYILKLAKKHKILIIDHHQAHENMNKLKNIIHVNPYFWKSRISPYKYASSKIVFDICSEIINIEDLDWLAGLGIINDFVGKTWKDFLDKIYKKYPYLKGKNLYSFDNKLGYINNLITAGYYYSKIRGGKIGYETCLKAKSPLNIIKLKTNSARKLKKMYDEIEREIQDTMKNWRKNAEIIENKKLIILELNTKFSIQSPVSTKISIQVPNYTVIVIKKEANKTYISFRRQDGKVDCGELATITTKNLENASGGGHIPAAGGNIMTKDWNKFKENVIHFL